MTVMVFLGPSLPLDEAEQILPGAVYRPPAKQADIVSALTNDTPSVVALIDGEFHQARSVWHKELLLALERGVRVFGASSMGALRAAELETYGMIGRGDVFAKFAAGELIDDDEVALAYQVKNGRYINLSEPMVNIRATCTAAVAAGAISAVTCRTAVEEAKALYYPSRTLATITRRLRERGIEDTEIEHLNAFWKTSAIDVKGNDARLLLEELRSLASSGEESICSRVRVAETAALNTLYDRERQVNMAGVQVALGEIAEHVLLHHPDAQAMNSAALNRALVLLTAKLLHVTPSKSEVEHEIKRWRARHGCVDEEDFACWLRRNRLTLNEFQELARESATCRVLHRWLVYCHFEERSTRFVLDHLRWEGEFETWAESASLSAVLADEDDTRLLDDCVARGHEALAEEHEDWTGTRFGTDLGTWAEEAGFNSLADLTLALARAKLTRLQLLRLLGRAVEAVGTPWGP